MMKKVKPAKDTVEDYKENIKNRLRHVGTVDALTLLYGAADHVGDNKKAYPLIVLGMLINGTITTGIAYLSYG